MARSFSAAPAPSPAPPDADSGYAIDLTQATKRYRTSGVAALRDVSLQLDRGASLAVMGPSGSGKSTLLHLVGGLDVATTGTVIVGGVDLGALNEAARSRWRRRHVAFVFQAYHLLPTLTCAQNVALPLHVIGLAHREIDRRVQGVLADLGLADRAAHVPDELSGGERQRVAIARALVTGAPLLLADEPTGNLDSTTGEQVLTLLLAATRARGATFLLVTHNHDAAARCDRILLLRDGRLEHAGHA